MQYFMTFLEGVISFISPCMLPMLPVYVSYFGGKTENRKSVLARVICFVAGFTLVFCALGLFAGSFGAAVKKYHSVVNAVCGILVVIFGLSYLEVFRLPFFKGMYKAVQINGVFSAFVFGVVYSVSLTPCVGAFLGSALMAASVSASAASGIVLLLTYSLGLAIPFVMSAFLLDRLGNVFGYIKSHYRIINKVCGMFLVVTGVLMATGLFEKILSVFGG